MFVALNTISDMKNGNPRGLHNLNRRKEDGGYIFVVIMLIIIVLVAMFGCSPAREINRVVDGQNNVYTLTKKGNKVYAAKNGKVYRVSYLK